MNKRVLTIGVAAVAITCQAGIKCWDNPEYKMFDVGDYAPGAFWHFDGIRNVGASAAHDSTATTWVNLGSGGSTYNTSDVAKGTGPAGEWVADGYVFKGGTRYHSGASVTVSGSWTVQMLVDADADSQTGSIAPVASVMIDWFAFLLNKSSGYFYARLNGGTLLPQFIANDHEYEYATVILDNENLTAQMFSGTTPPTSGDGYKTFASAIAAKSTTGFGLGSTSTDGQQFVGTLKSFRWYQRVLSPEELAWNRVVDEARFFNRALPIPVTNAVVATALVGASGMEPSGCYAVDGSHVFSAPETVRVGGVKYGCTGYTLEKRNGSVWTAPVLVQSCFCEVADSDFVRITWQWKEMTGLVTYDIGDYVWNGLVLFYDGICNVATNASHSKTATIWKNLGSVGAVNDLFFQRLNEAGNGWIAATDFEAVDGRDPGSWTADGFALKGDSRFRVVATGGQNGQIAVGNDYSLQMLIDAKTANQKFQLAYPFSLSRDLFSFQIDSSRNRLYWRTEMAALNDSENYSFMGGTTFDYMTAIVNSTTATTAFFSGTEIPTAGDGFRQYASVVGRTERGYDLGGYGNADCDRLLVGTIKFFRQYDHALSAEEVAQNRTVDNYRYFGAHSSTNVIVQTTCPYLHGDETEGAYQLAGESYTFTAPATVTAKGITYACDGYAIETWNGEAWGDSTAHSGNSYAYTTSAGKVRLTWRWKATRGLRTAADYSFDDYSQAGLFWNYDGIRNQGGTDSDHDSTATTWKNLGSGGAQCDLSFQGGTTTGEWADDGYIFRGGPRFWNGSTAGYFKSFTIQALVDADINDQNTNGAGYIMNVMWDYFDLVMRNDGNGEYNRSLYWNAQATSSNAHNEKVLYFRTDSGRYDYATAIMDYDAKTGQLFSGVEAPTSGTGFCQFGSVVSRITSGYGIGNLNNGIEGFVGTVKSIRCYDRVLTQEELVRNRNVDSVRYFGELGVTNVYVVAGGGTQAETGACKVEGEWTFTATTTVGKNGVTVPVVRYAIETLVNGVWTNKQTCDGNSYTYTEGTSPATVRLRWLGQPIGVRIMFR